MFGKVKTTYIWISCTNVSYLHYCRYNVVRMWYCVFISTRQDLTDLLKYKLINAPNCVISCGIVRALAYYSSKSEIILKLVTPGRIRHNTYQHTQYMKVLGHIM